MRPVRLNPLQHRLHDSHVLNTQGLSAARADLSNAPREYPFVVFIFVLYAMGIWYLCGKHRRQWKGVLWIVLGLAGIGVVGWLHYQGAVYFGRASYFSVMSHLLIPYAALVAFLGGAILTFPRKQSPDRCLKCGYDLIGHEVAEPICPECGTPHALPPRHMRTSPNVPAIRGGDPTGPLPDQERRPAFVVPQDQTKPPHDRIAGSTLPA